MPFDPTASMATPPKKRKREEGSEGSPESMPVLFKKRLREEDPEGSPEPANAHSIPEEVIDSCTWSVFEEMNEYSHEWFEPFEHNHEMRICREKLLEEIRHFVGDRDPYTCIPKSYQKRVVKDEEPHGYRLSLLRAILEGLRETTVYRRDLERAKKQLASKAPDLESEQSDEKRNTTDHDEASPVHETRANSQLSGHSTESPVEPIPGKRELDEANWYLRFVDEYRCLDCEHEKMYTKFAMTSLRAENRSLLERIAELEKMSDRRSNFARRIAPLKRRHSEPEQHSKASDEERRYFNGISRTREEVPTELFQPDDPYAGDIQSAEDLVREFHDSRDNIEENSEDLGGDSDHEATDLYETPFQCANCEAQKKWIQKLRKEIDDLETEKHGLNDEILEIWNISDLLESGIFFCTQDVLIPDLHTELTMLRLQGHLSGGLNEEQRERREALWKELRRAVDKLMDDNAPGGD